MEIETETMVMLENMTDRELDYLDEILSDRRRSRELEEEEDHERQKEDFANERIEKKEFFTKRWNSMTPEEQEKERNYQRNK